MKTISINTYKFEELDEAAQETAIENFRNINVEFFDWHDFELDYWKERLAEMGFMDAEIQFSGFRCQGDGVSFTANVDIRKMLDCIIRNSPYLAIKDFYGLLKLHEKDMVELDCSCERIDNHYAHENTCRARIWSDYYLENATEVFHDWFIETVDRLEQEIEDLRYRVSQDIYFSLRKEYEYLTSEEAIKETIKANDYDFLENGEMF